MFKEKPQIMSDRVPFEIELTSLINIYSKEAESDTPDYILAKHIKGCLENYAKTIKERDKWFGFRPFIQEELEK